MKQFQQLKKAVFLTLLTSVISALTMAQSKPITGKVISATDGHPLANVSVVIKGQTIGTQTNDDGDFTISATPQDVLVFTFVGHLTQEIKVGTQTELTVAMNTEASQLNEVVVVGYGTQKRTEFTGAASKVNALAIENNPSTNVATALQGTVPGLTVQQTTGQPGTSPNISFRGGTGFNGSGSPLVVVDGVILPSLYGLDMNDIESIDVLKDAASAAIYGARAANGVVLITTKKGKKGRTQISYNIAETRNYIRSIASDYMTTEEYLKMNRLGLRARYIADSLTGMGVTGDKGQLNGAWGWAFGPTNTSPIGLYTTQRVTDINRYLLSSPGWKLLVDPNPFFPSAMDSILYKDISTKTREDMLMRNTNTLENSLTFSGANDQGAFALSLNTVKDNGIIIGSWLKRMNLNFNGTLNIGKDLKVSLNTNAYDIQQAVPYSEPGIAGVTGLTGGLMQRFLGVAPTVRYYNDTSGAILPGPNDITLGNPQYWSTLFTNSTNQQRFMGSLNVEYKILPFLKFIANGSGYMLYQNNNLFRKAYQQGNGGSINSNRAASFSNYKDIQYTASAFLQFDKNINGHSITFMAGGETYDYKKYTFSGFAQGAPTDFIPWLTAATPPSVLNGTIVNPAGASSDFPYWERINSVIGRLNYSYKDKYFLTGILRVDGSSRLNPKNYFSSYPGVSVGWNLQKENFFQNSKLSNFITILKPRASFGENGNLSFFNDPSQFSGNPYFPTSQIYSSAGVYNGIGGAYLPNYINTDLKWERTNSLNFGADLGFWGNRITLIADYFIRNVFDKLANLPISGQTGFTSFTTNLSQLQNRGLELTLNAVLIAPKQDGGFGLNIGATYYTVKNYAIKLPFNGLPGNRQQTRQVWDPNHPGQFMYVNGLIQGQRIALDEVWAPKWDGIYTSQEMLTKDANVYNDYLPYTTNKKFKQLGDAKWHQVNPNDTINSYQFVYVGRTTPKATGSFFLDGGYKGFHLYAGFDYAYGFVILNNEKLRGLSQVQGSQNGTKDVLNTWTPANPNAKYPMYYWANQGRNFATDGSGNNPPANMWEKGDYIMVRELTLSYGLTPAILKSVFNDRLKGFSLSITGSNLAYITKYSGLFPEVGGFDNGRYPLPRRLTIGAKVTF